MKIEELQARQSKVDITIEVKEIGEIREFSKFGKVGRVANAIVGDDTGEIKLTLWNEDIDKVRVGSKIKITNGYVNEFQGEKQLTAGRFGKLEILDGEELEETEEADKAVEETIEETEERGEGPQEDEVTKDEKEESKKSKK